MMKEKVVIQSIQIKKKGELKSFQIKLPSDAKRIIGIETGIMGIDLADTIPPFTLAYPFRYPGIYLAGELRLQSCGKTNLFYSADVPLTNNVLGWGDWAQTPFFYRKRWTHNYKREEDPVLIEENCSVIMGTYKDKYGEYFSTNYPYQVNIYIWHERLS